jgi:hypothetical protein
MRGFALVALALAAAMCCADAAPTKSMLIRISKPGITTDILKSDLKTCRRISRFSWQNTEGERYPSDSYRRPQTFIQCLSDKGYRLDPKGFPLVVRI